MTIEQVFHYVDMVKWNETDEPPEKYADQVSRAARYRDYPELTPTPDGQPRTIVR